MHPRTCNTPSTPGPTILTPDNSLGSYIVPTDQHESFVCTLSSLMCTRENFPVGHPSQIASSQARLTWRFFRDRLPKKKMHLVGMDTLLILLSLGPGYHHPRGQDITIVTPRPIPGPAVLIPGSSLGSYIVPTDQHESFVRTLFSLMCIRENFPVGHPSQDCSGPSTLNPKVLLR